MDQATYDKCCEAVREGTAVAHATVHGTLFVFASGTSLQVPAEPECVRYPLKRKYR